MAGHAEHDTTSATPAAPPTRPVAVQRAAERSSWPTVIGVVALVFGCMGLLGGLGALLSFFWFEAFAPEPQVQALAAVPHWKVTSAILSVLGLLAAVVLVLSGVWLLRRRRAGIRVAVVWAVLKLLVVGLGLGLTYETQRLQFEAMQNDPNMRVVPGEFFDLIGGFSILAGLAWGWALPIFFLVWFSRKKVKSEVAGWT